MSDDVTITVRVDDRTAAGFRDVDGRLRSMDGRFATSAGSMQRSAAKANTSINGLKSTFLSLAPAAVPVAASLAPIAIQAGAAGLALASFGAALKPQISSLSEASKAQDAYSSAVQKSGRGSKQAADAQLAVSRTLAGMPAATQRAAVAWQGLREQTSAWSDSLAKFTMAPVEKAFTVMGQLVPKLTPMVKGTSEQLNRLMDVAGGGISTGAFDTLSQKVSDLANNTLKGATDKAIHFIRVLSEGNATGPIASFMDYARANGPATKELLTNLSEAVANLLEGASQAGPGLLTLVNAMAKLVASVPPELIGNLMQVYAAFKLIKLAGAGVGAVAGSFATLGTRIAALRAASVAAGGGIAGMNAALGTLSTGGKAALALGVVGALSLAMHKLSDNKDPVAVDALSTSLNTLATTGKVTGTLSTNFDEMSKSIAMMSKGASDNKFLQMASDFGTWVGIAKGPGISDATKNLDAWDKVMANNVRAGNPKLAAQQYEILRKAWLAGHGDLGRLKELTTDYSDAMADQTFEQQHAAEAMGIFGVATLNTQAKLTAQKTAADGLRSSIIALNDVNRSAYDSEIAFEASIDSLSESFKANGATLDIHSKAGQQNGQAMSAAAKANDEMIASGIAANESLGSMTKKSGELRSEMLKLATEAFDGNKKKAQEYVNTLMGVPSEIETLVKAEKREAIEGLNEVEAAIRKTPGAKKITVSTLNGAAIKALEAVGFKTKTLPDGRTQVFTATGKSLGSIAAVTRALNALNGKTATTWTYHKIHTSYSTSNSVSGGKSVHDMVGATGGLYTGKGSGFRYADGGPVRGPGTGTSDDVPAPWLSNGEFVIKAAAVQKYGERFLQRVNDGQLDGARYARGGKVTSAEKEARADLRDQFGISHFGVKAGYQRTPFEKGLGGAEDMGSLVSALNAARGNIKRSTHGGTESRLLKQLDSVGKAMIKQERQLTAVNKALDKAKDKLADLKSAAASLSSSVRGGVLSASNITKGASGDAPVTVASIMSGATQSRDKAKSFAGALKALQKKGLDKGLIEDIANAGVDGGGLETAGALMGASASEIKSLNTLRSQTATYAKQAGGTAADAVYGAAIKAQTAAVSKLQKSQDKLEKSMAHLARVMEKSISKAIGKKAAGGVVGMAASGGIRSGLTWVGEQGPELADLPVGSRVWSSPDSQRKARAPWESMLNTPRGGGARTAGAAAGGASQPIVVHQTIELDGRVIARQIFDPLREEVAHRGGVVQRALGQGAG